MGSSWPIEGNSSLALFVSYRSIFRYWILFFRTHAEASEPTFQLPERVIPVSAGSVKWKVPVPSMRLFLRLPM